MNRLLAWLTSVILAAVIAGCGPLELLNPRKFQDGVAQTTPFHDGVTQTTPLVSGEIRLESGEPAANVTVTAYVSEYRVSSVGEGVKQVETRTDASGRFHLVNPPLGMNTIEAEASPESKAIRMNVPVTVGARLSLDPMTLLPTGAITGQVTAEGQPNLLGTTVFIPGTQYVGMTAENGTYTLKNVPVGEYELAAMRQTFATTLVSGVTVTPRQTVQAPEIRLRLDAPVLESLSQSNGGSGTELLLRGRNFGASKNTMLMVKFESMQATRFERVSDTEIRVWVPQGAVSGPVVVISNGVASNPLNFQVLASLLVKPYYAGLYVGERQTFEIEARDGFGERVPHPFFVWELEADFLGTFSQQGELTTREPGRSEVRARSGDLVGRGAVGVTPFALSPPSRYLEAELGGLGTLVARPEGLYFPHPRGNRLYFSPPGEERSVLAGTGIKGYSPDGTPALEAHLDLPDSLAVDAQGNVYFTERGHHLVRVIPRSDTTYAGRNLQAGRIYTVAGNRSQDFKGDGGAATQASLNTPWALALGEGGSPLLGGSLLVTDTQNGRIREVRADGTIATVVGGGGLPVASEGTDAALYGGGVGFHLARDNAGNLAFSSGHQLLFYCRVPGTYFERAMSAGKVYRVAGRAENGFDGDGPGTSVRLSSPRGLTFDPWGNLYFSEGGTGAVRVLTASGNVRWLAGLRLPPGYSNAPTITEVAPATSVKLDPYNLVLRADGTLVVGDSSRLYLHELTRRIAWPVHSQ